MMGPIHIKASKDDVAERVIVAGDPARVEQIASMLENVKLVNRNRGLLVYTGEYEGTRISVALHGIGAPSSAIVFEELAMLGAKVMIRIGTCGAMYRGARIGDVVVPTGASYYPGGFYHQYLKEGVCLCAVPDFVVTKVLVEELERSGISYRVGPVVSSDAFYAEDPDFAKKWMSRGVIAVEMECAALFSLGMMRGFRTGAVLIVSDSLIENLGFASAEELKEHVDRVTRAVFRALKRL